MGSRTRRKLEDDDWFFAPIHFGTGSIYQLSDTVQRVPKERQAFIGFINPKLFRKLKKAK